PLISTHPAPTKKKTFKQLCSWMAMDDESMNHKSQ
ncbi:MAG: hypothetical protein ACI90V_007597, partial [Bacillariaceae sp.]